LKSISVLTHDPDGVCEYPVRQVTVARMKIFPGYLITLSHVTFNSLVLEVTLVVVVVSEVVLVVTLVPDVVLVVDVVVIVVPEAVVAVVAVFVFAVVVAMEKNNTRHELSLFDLFQMELLEVGFSHSLIQKIHPITVSNSSLE
jgi:hypothetical protein